MIEKFIFYLLSILMIFSAIRVITSKNHVHAALFLVLTFFTSAMLWLLIEAEFLAITIALVYVGAVMVLFLFVIMTIDLNNPAKKGLNKYSPISGLIILIISVEILSVFGTKYFKSLSYHSNHAIDYSNTKELGYVIYTVYSYPLEIASVILLVAIISAIYLTFRHRDIIVKSQNVSKQINISKNDRINIVNLKEK